MIDYDQMLSSRAMELKPSGIRKFFDILEEMQDVVSLTVGQPDFDTPWHIREAGIRSLEEGRTYYTSNSGTVELRREISAYQKRRFGLEYDPKNEIIVTVGGSEAIDLALRAVVNIGDEVIVPEPCFVCYSPLVTLAGGAPVTINLRAENDFRLTAAELEAAITPKTKAVVLAFPNNPTGAVLDGNDLENLAEVIRRHNILVISDEIYAELTYGERHVSIASLDGMRERTIIAAGFSKSYAMTGWRLGYTLAPPEITAQMLKIHQFAIMCAPTASQFAAVEAVRNGDEDIEFMKAEYDGRRRFVVSGLHDMGIDCFVPRGAFYVFPDISGFGMTSEEFCGRLLREKHVAIVPGTAFGECGEGFARISYAYSLRHLEKALKRMEEFINDLQKG
ncbi:MAG: aminotransferase class I/II-fold pyridoxal phosphate-dependent enzyme [Ruminococcus sp.]|mgnify:FL=1|nr:aminotransferase class I/II-fold pyridoxal phosphate-dependent enzyme [Ruminococcus sp.]MDD7670610.1 aminotransferase class I/II-fold pyridoxal phosphate-dependent enzyme [Ruminococcus sp.]CDD04575.1 aminotransferase class I and II [Ruminococcus sp. CAG:382]